MKKIIDFLGRDIVNTFVLVLTVILGVVSVITGNDIGYFYCLLAVFIFRFMLWHYGLWDKVNDNVMDNEMRVSVFGLMPVDSNKSSKHGKLYSAVNLIIFLVGIGMLALFVLELLK